MAYHKGARLQWLATALCLASSSVALANAEVVGYVSTTWRWIRNDRIVVNVFDDPKVEGVSCYVSRAATGGAMGLIGLAEDPARMSIACRQTGPIRFRSNPSRSENGEIVFSENQSALFKELRVTRMVDSRRSVLVYLVWSTKELSPDGSPFNSVTAVPFDVPLPR